MAQFTPLTEVLARTVAKHFPNLPTRPPVASAPAPTPDRQTWLEAQAAWAAANALRDAYEQLTEERLEMTVAYDLVQSVLRRYDAALQTLMTRENGGTR